MVKPGLVSDILSWAEQRQLPSGDFESGPGESFRQGSHAFFNGHPVSMGFGQSSGHG